MSETAATPPPAASQAAPRDIPPMTIYSHSNLLYWWVVWMWGYVCAALTWIQGKPFKFEPTAREWLVHPHPWVGWSFVGVVLLTVLFTNIRLKTMATLLLFGVLAAATAALHYFVGLQSIAQYVSLALIHMNMAFYVVLSTGLLLFWLIVLFFADTMSYWRFEPGLIREVHRLEQENNHSFSTANATIQLRAGDFIRHKILGLGLAGFGTGNIEVMPTGSNGPRLVIENVWRVKDRLDGLNRLVTARRMIQS